MKLALIPPTPELNEFGHGKFHLLLNHLLKDKAYTQWYNAQRNRGAYLVLDNSAHEEGVGNDPEVLMYNALALHAQEVVVPDVLDKGPETVDRGVEALEVWFEGKYARIRDESPALMYVPQGRNEMEWVTCLTQLIDLHQYMARGGKYRSDFVIGISKDYQAWEGGLAHLIYDYVLPLKNMYQTQMQVHLLGWHKDIYYVKDLARQFPWIRSTDTAKAFCLAREGTRLTMRPRPIEWPGRQNDYFDKVLTATQRKAAWHNTLILKALAGA